jgi:Flp pilus assembly pilin Flp
MKGRCKRFLIFKNRKARKKNMKDQMVRVAKEFAADESGVGVVEMILILVVLIGLVIIFKKQLTNLVNSIFETINSKAGSI